MEQWTLGVGEVWTEDLVIQRVLRLRLFSKVPCRGARGDGEGGKGDGR